MPRRFLAPLALAAALVACGDDGSADDTAAGPATVATSAAPTTGAPTTVAPTTEAPSTAAPTTATPATAPASTVPATTPAAPPSTAVGQIEVNADTDAVRTITVPLGTPVTLTVRSATAQEFHLHGYDLELTGTEVVFQFTADLAGSFELESHDSGELFAVLEVV